MSRPTNQIDNTEYYLETDTTNKKVSVKKYVFDVLAPNGRESRMCSLSYRKKSGFTCEEAEEFLGRIVDMLNNTDWRDENNVY